MSGNNKLAKTLKTNMPVHKNGTKRQGERQTPGECLLQNDPSNICARVRASEAKRFPGSGECWAHFHPSPTSDNLLLLKTQQILEGRTLPTTMWERCSNTTVWTVLPGFHADPAPEPQLTLPGEWGGGELMLLCPHGINMTSQITSTSRPTISSKIKSTSSQN